MVGFVEVSELLWVPFWIFFLDFVCGYLVLVDFIFK